MTELNREIAIPLYVQIAEDIKEQIHREELKVDSKIATELELSSLYRVSRITIRKALQQLVDDEILVRKQRLGTFVSGKKMYRNLNTFAGFSRRVEAEGKHAGTKLLSAELVKPTETEATRLQIASEELAIRIRRLRYCNEIPVIIENNLFPKKYAFLLSYDLTGSIYEILAQNSIELNSVERTIGLCYATREEAMHLGLKEHDALILSKEIVYDINGEVSYLGKEVINSDRYEFKIRTNNRE